MADFILAVGHRKIANSWRVNGVYSTTQTEERYYLFPTFLCSNDSKSHKQKQQGSSQTQK